MNSKLIDKIKKLLALSSSPVPAEAELALSKAKALMEEYGISLIEDKTETIVEHIYAFSEGKLNADFQIAVISIAGSIAPLFHCMMFIRMNRPVIVGLETNVEVTFHALDCILHSLWYDYRQLRKENRSLAFSVNFWKGAADGIREKFRPKPDAVRSEFGIILYDQVRDYIKQKYPQMGTWSGRGAKSESQSGLSEGQRAGSSATIKPGIRSGFEGRLLN